MLPPIGSLVADKYRIEALLGEGGMGAVFAARHELMDKPVALKWLKPQLAESSEARDRFMREARAAARINHPNVVEVYDVGVHQGALFMVMERLGGQSLENLLEQDNGLSIPQALRLLIGAMHGVQAAHDKGIIHRDIKPDNIFITHDPHRGVDVAKVLDFGISKLNEEVHGVSSFTRTGSVMGTPLYMSLEQINGSRDVDARADVYSFGVLLYRALTGELPFNGDTLGMLAIQVATVDPPRAKQLRPDLPTMLDDVVMKAIARNRDDRYSSMRELIDALAVLSSAEGFLGKMTYRSATPPQLTPKTPMPAAHMSSTTSHVDTLASNAAPPSSAQTAFAVNASDSVRPAGLPKNRALRFLVAAVLLLFAMGGVWAIWGNTRHRVVPAAQVDAPLTEPKLAPEGTALAPGPAGAADSEQAAGAAPPISEQVPGEPGAQQAASETVNGVDEPAAKAPTSHRIAATRRKELQAASKPSTVASQPIVQPVPSTAATVPPPKPTTRVRTSGSNKETLRSGKKMTTSDF